MDGKRQPAHFLSEALMSRELVSQLKTLFNHRYARNITYRAMARADAFPLFQATQNPEFNRYLLWNAPLQERDVLPQVDKLLREATMDKTVVLSMGEKDTGTWLGLGLLKPFRDGLELSLYLHPKRWNTGSVFVCGRGIIEAVFEAFPDLPMYVRMHPKNRRMERICLAYRFKPTEGDTAQHATQGALDLLVYRLEKAHWEPFPDVQEY